MTDSRSSRGDLLTVMAIAIIAYILGTILHEAVGHGGACLLVGGQPKEVSTVHFDHVHGQLSAARERVISSGGTIVNLLAGAVFLLLLRAKRNASPQLVFFLWLSMTINLLQGAGYFLFSGIGNIGDWAAIVRGLHPVILWRGGLALLGAVTYFAFVILALREMGAIIGGEAPERSKRAGWLALMSYLTGGVMSCIAGALNPYGMILVAISAAAASFGGTSGLAWMMDLLERPSIPKITRPPLVVGRSVPWIVAAVLLVLPFIFVLGPAIRF